MHAAFLSRQLWEKRLAPGGSDRVGQGGGRDKGALCLSFDERLLKTAGGEEEEEGVGS